MAENGRLVKLPAKHSIVFLARMWFSVEFSFVHVADCNMSRLTLTTELGAPTFDNGKIAKRGYTSNDALRSNLCY